MNDWKLGVTKLEEAVQAIHDELSPAERFGIYAGVRAILADLAEEVDDRFQGDTYAHEKIGNAEWHFGAALGLDVDNGHPISQHRVWALGALSSLRSSLERRTPAY